MQYFLSIRSYERRQAVIGYVAEQAQMDKGLEPSNQ